MYYLDLSTYPHELSRKGYSLLSVGWLGAKHPYTQGEVSVLFVERLWIFCCTPLFYTLGYHNCPFCRVSSFGILVQRGNEERQLGSAEIRVLGREHVIYAAPDLIYHYVVKHRYRPPDEFIQSVLDGPLPGSREYESVRNKMDWHQ